MAGGAELNQGKQKELVLYMSQQSAEDEGFGMVKLNKLLYRADFEAYRVLGHSITGETYEKQEYGPVARHLLIALDDLASRHYIVWQHPQRGPYKSHVPAATEPPDMDMFSPDELAVVDKTLNELAAHGGKSISEWSHETSAGWRVKKIGQEIPYSSAVINLKPLTEKTLKKLRARLAARYA